MKKRIIERFERTQKLVIVRCDNKSPSGAFECELPWGHEGQHRETVTHLW